MNTKVLYVLVSNPKDIYLEQAFVSISSLRHHMKNGVEIIVLTDKITKNTLIGSREQMLSQVNEIIAIDLPSSYTAQNRSRILKTSCRKYIQGDFLFIDCDTIITKKLDEIDNITSEIAACYDSHSLFASNPYRKMCINDCLRLGIDIKNEQVYYNSGVILVKDTPASHAFFDVWSRNWLEGREKGVNMDQPSFAKTNIEFNHFINRLPDIWNCELVHGIRFLKDTKIVHYLCTNKTSKINEEIFILRNHSVLEQIKKTGIIPPEVKVCFDDPFCGIPELTTIVSGDSVYFIRSQIYQYYSTHLDNWIFRCTNKVIGFIKRLSKLKKK